MSKGTTYLMLVICLLLGAARTEGTSGAVQAVNEAGLVAYQGQELLTQVPEAIMNRVAEFMAVNRTTPEFAGKTPYAAYPVYAYGIEGAAYYEIWLSRDGKTTAGWLLMSVTDQDYPLVNFSNEGTPYSQKALANAAELGVDVRQSDRIYRWGVSYFTLEDEHGVLLGEFGSRPTWLPGVMPLSGSGAGDSINGQLYNLNDGLQAIEGVHYYSVNSYEELQQRFPASYFTPERARLARDMRVRIFPAQGHGEAYQDAEDAYIYRWINSNQCYYTQIQAHFRYNTTDCYSGCNNNAWTSLYGWWDKNQGKSKLIPTTSTGETCTAYRNTTARQDVVDPIEMWFRNYCDTDCDDGGGWTSWSDAWLGFFYTAMRGYGFYYWYQWCTFTGCDSDLANILVECIGNNYRPAHVGANSHFYVGIGFAQWDTNTDWTWVDGYPGWSENHNDDVWMWWNDLNTVTEVFVH